MKKIRFIVFRGKSVVSKMIRFFTRSKFYSHVGYLSYSNHLVECWPTVKNPFQNWIISGLMYHKGGTDYEVWSLEVDKETHEAVEKYFHGMLGIKYNWLGILGFIIKRDFEYSDRKFCSEGCVQILIDKFNLETIKASHVSPQNFVEILDTLGGKLERKGIV